MAWLPVFFMFFNSIISIGEVLKLEALYYISVVILEVPSGYFSDKVGRKITLILSSLFFVIAYALFGFLPSTFATLCIAQVFLAGGMSFISGTDTAFYFESLKKDGRQSEFLSLDANVQTWKNIAGAFAVFIGGVIGYYSLRYAYVISFVLVIPSLIIAFGFQEPESNKEESLSIFEQFKELGRLLSNKVLRWVFIFSICLFILSHIPYEFYQTYLEVLDDKKAIMALPATIASGILFFFTRIIGAYSSYMSPRLMKMFGFRNLCLLALILQLMVIGSMANIMHVLMLSLILLRGVSSSIVVSPINSIVAPKLGDNNRATYFSIQSLVSRFSFSITLIGLSSLTVAGNGQWENLSIILNGALGLGLVLMIVILLLPFKNEILKSSS